MDGMAPTQADGGNIPAASNVYVYLINYFAATMFKSLEVYINNNKITVTNLLLSKFH